ncbi:c-type cytochrome [Pseudomonas aeruginosa]|uniref:c-type cytochrome n=1 Tax=Pseudomonas aeruginosa TaxID=287 RepID=UPI000EB10326|nr:cytochrome c [Pseudomonas aeruginosa]NNB83815.1 cytochrome c [Pseudomonas aeruginosa]
MLSSIKSRAAFAALASCLAVAGLTWAGDGSDGSKTTNGAQPVSRQMENFARNCQGCHGSTGVSVKEVPPLANRIGYFTRAEEGRAYLVQVPNVALSVLNDKDLAEMLNWMLIRFGSDQLPADFKPYTADEVGQLRKVRITPTVRRAEVVKLLEDRQLVPSKDTLSLPLPGTY